MIQMVIQNQQMQPSTRNVNSISSITDSQIISTNEIDSNSTTVPTIVKIQNGKSNLSTSSQTNSELQNKSLFHPMANQSKKPTSSVNWSKSQR